jgi:hypothetical protein
VKEREGYKLGRIVIKKDRDTEREKEKRKRDKFGCLSTIYLPCYETGTLSIHFWLEGLYRVSNQVFLS